MSIARFIFAALAGLVLVGCAKVQESTQDDSEVLVAVDDSTLTVRDVVRQIPSGLEPEDSAAMFQQIVDEWVRDLVLVDYAEKNIPDLDRIEQLTQDYRNNLIINRYMQIMSESSANSVSEQRIKDYFDAHKSEMVLEQPLVKGALLIVADNDDSLGDLRKWMAAFTDESIDKIEKSGLKQASRYEYFKDTWHEWSAVADLIPYRFVDADAFLRSNKNFETSRGGTVCLLHISDYISSGSQMPFDFAKLRIKEILNSSDNIERRSNMIRSIYEERIKEGNLKVGAYDPVNSVMINRK